MDSPLRQVILPRRANTCNNYMHDRHIIEWKRYRHLLVPNITSRINVKTLAQIAYASTCSKGQIFIAFKTMERRRSGTHCRVSKISMLCSKISTGRCTLSDHRST